MRRWSGGFWRTEEEWEVKRNVGGGWGVGGRCICQNKQSILHNSLENYWRVEVRVEVERIMDGDRWRWMERMEIKKMKVEGWWWMGQLL